MIANDSGGSVKGEHIFVNIPIGRVDFVVGSPTDELPVDDEIYGHAEDDASIVGVSWVWDPGSAFHSMAGERTREIEPHVTLVADVGCHRHH